MTSALILLASEGTEEIEFVTVYDVLVRAGITPQSLLIRDPNASADDDETEIATCTRKVRIIPDEILQASSLTAEEITTYVEKYDILILPGGGPGAARFGSHVAVKQLLAGFAAVRPDDQAQGKVNGNRRWIATICAATAGMVEAFSHNSQGQATSSASRSSTADKKPIEVVGHPSVRDKVVGQPGWKWIDDQSVLVHVDGQFITSRGPGTALLWSLAIVEQLKGKTVRDEVATPMILPSA